MMTDSDELYTGMDVDDDLSSAMGTETLADRDLMPLGFDNPEPCLNRRLFSFAIQQATDSKGINYGPSNKVDLTAMDNALLGSSSTRRYPATPRSRGDTLPEPPQAILCQQLSWPQLTLQTSYIPTMSPVPRTVSSICATFKSSVATSLGSILFQCQNVLRTAVAWLFHVAWNMTGNQHP